MLSAVNYYSYVIHQVLTFLKRYLDQKAAEKLEKEERHKNEQEDNMKNVEEMEILEQEELKKVAFAATLFLFFVVNFHKNLGRRV